MQIPELPAPPAEIAALAQRHREIRADRHQLEPTLRSIETTLARRAIGEDHTSDELVDALVEGKTLDRARLPADAAELRGRLNIVIRADQKLAIQLADARDKHNRQIAKALKPAHRRAIRRIWAALQELEEANAEEQAVRAVVPGVPLQACDFPNIGVLRSIDAPIRRWQRFAQNLYPGFADEDDPAPAPKPTAKRSLFSRSNGAAGPVPMAAKGTD